MSNDITIIFDDVIKQYRSLESAEEAFRAMLEADKQLESDYQEWCDTMGVSTRKGFACYYEEYIEQQDSVWDSLEDHDE